MRKAAIPLLVMLLSLFSSLVAAQVGVEQVEVGPPDDASQLMKNPSFEFPPSQDEHDGWYFHPYTERVDYVHADGDWSMRQHLDPGASVTQALQVFDFRQCVSDVWVHLCWRITTSEPLQNGEMDTCEVALYNEDRVWIATLFHGSNLDASSQWKCDWYRVLNLQDFEETVLFLDAWDSGAYPSACYWDHLSAWCVVDRPFKAYLTTVLR